MANNSENPVAHRQKCRYDGLSQLIDANISNINGGIWTAGYTYEDNGNMTGRTVQSSQTSFTYTGSEMTSAGNSISIKYDPSGNRIAKNSTVNGNRKYIVDTVGVCRSR